jgi:hypothetical protein
MAGRWRPDEDAWLRRQYHAGVRLAAIAREIGRSEDAVAARRAALGLRPRRPSRPWSGLEDTLLREAAGIGVRAGALAQRLHRPVGQVRARRRQLGLGRAAAPRYSSADDALLRAEWASGDGVEQLARRRGRSPDACATAVAARFPRSNSGSQRPLSAISRLVRRQTTTRRAPAPRVPPARASDKSHTDV